MKLSAQKIIEGQPTVDQSIKDAKEAVKRHAVACKEYSQSVLANLADITKEGCTAKVGEGDFIALCNDFRILAQASPQDKALAVNTSTWIKGKLSPLFSKCFPGKHIAPIKNGVAIVGYESLHMPNESTEKRVAEIAALLDVLPELFAPAFRDVAAIRAHVEEAEKNAESIAHLKARNAKLDRQIMAIRAEAASVEADIAAFARYGTVPKQAKKALDDMLASMTALEAEKSLPLQATA